MFKHLPLPPSNSLLLTVPSFGGTSVVVPECYMLLNPCVYGLQQYGHLNNSCPLCFLFSSVLVESFKRHTPPKPRPFTLTQTIKIENLYVILVSVSSIDPTEDGIRTIS